VVVGSSPTVGVFELRQGSMHLYFIFFFSKKKG
jgi:hypothetical protein